VPRGRGGENLAGFARAGPRRSRARTAGRALLVV